MLPRLTLLCLCLIATAPLAAQEDATLRALIDRVAEAYGGTALGELRNYSITERYIAPNTGQSWDPALTDIGQRNFQLVHDLENAHLYQESWFITPAGRFPNLSIVNGDGAWNINLRSGRYGAAANADPYAIAGGTMRTTDTLLARELLAARDSAEHLGNALWRNRPHERVRIPFPLSPDLTLYVDRETGLISRMNRENPLLGLLDYTFDEHVAVDGLMTASAVAFSIAGEPNLVGRGRTVRFNQPLDADQFRVPDDLEPEGERIADREMVVNRLADNVYHIGQNGAYSVFVGTPEGVIATGGYAGLAGRLQRYREETGDYRPLRYQVVTHHHQDHIGGIDEALALGATLVTEQRTAPVLRAASRRAPADSQFLLVDGRLTLGSGDGRVEIHDVSTTHAMSNLLFYVPSTRTLFLADHFGSPFAEGAPTANGNTVSMAAALEPLGLGYRRIVTAHNARVYSDRDFTASVRAFEPYRCPGTLPLCER